MLAKVVIGVVGEGQWSAATLHSAKPPCGMTADALREDCDVVTKLYGARYQEVSSDEENRPCVLALKLLPVPFGRVHHCTGPLM